MRAGGPILNVALVLEATYALNSESPSYGFEGCFERSCGTEGRCPDYSQIGRPLDHARYRRYQRTAQRMTSGAVCRHLKIAGRVTSFMVSSGYQLALPKVATQPFDQTSRRLRGLSLQWTSQQTISSNLVSQVQAPATELRAPL